MPKRTVESMPRYRYPDYDSVYEDFDGELGNLQGWDIRGHIPFEDVDLFLASMSWEYADCDPEGDFEVEHLWRCTVKPVDFDGNEIEDYDAYDYSTEESEGRIPVTRIAHSWITRYWCVNHPMEPYKAGVPSSSIINGAEVVRLHLEMQEAWEQDAGLEARIVVSKTPYDVGYIYYCADCYESYSRRLEAARKEALAEYQKGTAQ